jgi:hypothetical protein
MEIYLASSVITFSKPKIKLSVLSQTDGDMEGNSRVGLEERWSIHQARAVLSTARAFRSLPAIPIVG